MRSRLVEVGPAVRGHADSLLSEGQGILAGTSEPLLLKMTCRESEAHETELGITTLWLMEAMVSVLTCRVQSNSF